MKNSVRPPLAKSVPLVLVGSCLFLLSCNNSPVEDSPIPDGKQMEGERWFGMQHCDGCHGKEGLGGQAPEIQMTELSYQDLLQKIRESKSITMPSYPNKYLSDQEIADICSYLHDKNKLPSDVAGTKNVVSKSKSP